MSGVRTTSYRLQKLPVQLLDFLLSRSAILAKQRGNFPTNVSAIKTANYPCHSIHRAPRALQRLFVHRLLSFPKQKHFAMDHLATQFGRTSEDKFLPLSQ
jgi:hypothetical protein